MSKRAAAVIVSIGILLGACSDAPEPGDLAGFCSLLEIGTGLSPTSNGSEYEQLLLVAPPEVRPTIETLRTRAQDFDELLTLEPPDLAAMFRARFDPAAAEERAELDAFAETSCGIELNRPPATRWANYVREHHEDAGWRDAVTVQFEVAGERIVGATSVFGESPGQIDHVEQVCEALSDFLMSEGSPGSVQVLIGTIVVLSEEASAAGCELP